MRTSGEGVLEIRTHPDKGRGGDLEIRDFGGRPLCQMIINTVFLDEQYL